MKLYSKKYTIALEEGGIGGVPTRMKKREMNNENMKNGELFSWRTEIGIKEY